MTRMKFLVKVEDYNLYLVHNVYRVKKVNERVLNTIIYMLVLALLACILITFLLACKLLDSDDVVYRRVMFEPVIKEEAFDVDLYPDERANMVLSHPGYLESVASTSKVKHDEFQELSKFTPEEVDLLNRLVFLEAGTEDSLGLRLVCDVVLNRVDSKKFPNSIKEVIFENETKLQFAAATRDDFYTVQVPKRVKEAVTKELYEGREDSKSLYFGTSPITSKGLYQHGRHHFSQ